MEIYSMFSLFSSQCASNGQTHHNKWPPRNNHEVLLYTYALVIYFINSRLPSLKNAIIHSLSFS